MDTEKKTEFHSSQDIAGIDGGEIEGKKNSFVYNR